MAQRNVNLAEIFRDNREVNIDNLEAARGFLGDDVLREIAGFVPEEGNLSFRQKLNRYAQQHKEQFNRFLRRNRDAVVNFWEDNKYEIIQRGLIGTVSITGLSFSEIKTMSARMASLNYIKLLDGAIEADAVELIKKVNISKFSKEDKEMIKQNIVDFLRKKSDLTNAFTKYYGLIRTPILGKLDTLGIMQLIALGKGTIFKTNVELDAILTGIPFAVSQLKGILDNLDNTIILNKLISKQNHYEELKKDILKKIRREKGKLKKKEGIKTLTQSQLESKLSKLNINKENEEAIIKSIMSNFTKEQLEQIVLDRGESVPKKISKKELAEFVTFMVRFDAKTIDGKVKLNLG